MTQEETLALFARGKDAWNAWAEEMLAQRRDLEAAGDWALSRGPLGEQAPSSDATVAWVDEATAIFSTEDAPYTFEVDVDLSDWTFPWDARFGGATFMRNASFKSATFAGVARFNGATFTRNASFASGTFTASASFASATFKGIVSFDSAMFTGAAWFVGATFTGDALFESATFTEDAWFDGATFTGEARFDGAVFTGDAWFFSPTFTGDAWFYRVTFTEDAWFISATFTGIARFDGANFTGIAWFDSATFTGEAWFAGVTFTGVARFAGATFEGLASYDHARFERDARFTAIHSERSFSLAGSTFFGVPDFIQARFGEAPRLDNLHFRRALIQPRGSWGRIRSCVERLSGGDRDVPARWRALKRLAVQGHDHDSELRFFPMEIRSARMVTDWPLPWPPWRADGWHGFFRFWFGILYGLTASYGRSVILPVLWWLGLSVFSAAIYLGQNQIASGSGAMPLSGRMAAVALQPVTTAGDLHAKYPCIGVSEGGFRPLEPQLVARTNALSEALHLAWTNGAVLGGLGGPESARRTYGCLYGFVRNSAGRLALVVPAPVSTWLLVQKTLSVVLIFLFGLGIRNMLKVK